MTIMDQQDLKDIWDNPQTNVSEEEISNALKTLLSRISLYEELSSRKKRYIQRLYKVLKIAGIFLLPILASYITYYFLDRNPVIQETLIANTEYAVPLGERREVLLDDGTVVYLNSGSILITPEKFIGKERNVYLVGEGYFKIASNKEKPFKVKTSLVEIEALGTEFSVSAYPQDNSIKTILAEGSVRLSVLDVANAPSIVMIPNHQSLYTPDMNGFMVSEVNALNHISWKDGILIFDKTPINDVLRRVEIQCGVQIIYDRSNKTITKHDITAKFIHDESLTEILDVLSEVVEFNYQITNNQVIIK